MYNVHRQHQDDRPHYTYRIEDHMQPGDLLAFRMGLTGIAILLVIVITSVIAGAIALSIAHNIDGLSYDEIDDMNNIMQNFHKDPNFDDYMVIHNNYKQLSITYGNRIKFWIWGVYQTHPEYFEANSMCWNREIARSARQFGTTPTRNAIDCIWALYYSTGNTTYINTIRRITERADPVVRDYALQTLRLNRV